MSPGYFLCIGHSHLDCILNEYKIGKESGRYQNVDLEFVELRHSTPYEYYALNPDKIGPELSQALDRVQDDRGAAPDAVFLSVGGSDQHTIAMLNHPQRMDVILPWAPTVARIEESTLIPFRLMERQMLVEGGWKLNLLALLANRYDCPKFFFQAPPPIGSEEHLKRYPGPQFKDLSEEFGFSSLEFRMKVSSINDFHYRTKCEELGVEFLYAPARALEPNGSLSVHACTEDSIHAGVVYGGYLIDQMCDASSLVRGAVS